MIKILKFHNSNYKYSLIKNDNITEFKHIFVLILLKINNILNIISTINTYNGENDQYNCYSSDIKKELVVVTNLS